jgi:serine/threonine protein kinase
MGVVYLATRGSQSVALKVLNSASMESPQAKTRFRKEVETLGQIRSDFVAKVVDSDVDDDYNWLAVEFVNGPDLKALVEDRGPLPEQEWLTLATGLLSGIDAIHSQGLIHRDIKPGNILIAESGPKIIDFGIAQDLDSTSLTMTGSVAGSPAWLSPEQIDGAKLTQATDLFSAGSVLHFAASGISPWGDHSTSATSVMFNNILTKDPDTSMLPELQRTLVDALLEKEPSDRLSAHEALKLLREIAEDTSFAAIDNAISTPRPETKNPPVKTSRATSALSREKKMFFGAIGAVGILAAVFLVPTVINQPKFSCAETSYAQGDLTNSSFEAISSSQFLNVLSRECAPIENSSYAFKIENCVYRADGLETAEGSDHKIVRLSEGKSNKGSMRFTQQSGGRYGCRSFVQLGLLSESEARGSSLGFTNRNFVPFSRELGRLKAGESRYELMSDGRAGTFITRFFASTSDELQVSLSTPEFQKLSLEIKYKSGYVPAWASSPQNYSKRLWEDSSGLNAIAGSCFVNGYLNELRVSNKVLRLESLKSGTWVPLAGHTESDFADCGDGDQYVQTRIPEAKLLSFKKTGGCNEVRYLWPATGSYRQDVTVFCFSLKQL